MAKDYKLQECFDNIRALIDYDFIKNQKEYAIHLLEISKNDKNEKAWQKDFEEKHERFMVVFGEVIKEIQIRMHDDDEFIRLLNSKYESGYFRGFNAGLTMVAEGMLKSLKKLE